MMQNLLTGKIRLYERERISFKVDKQLMDYSFFIPRTSVATDGLKNSRRIIGRYLGVCNQPAKAEEAKCVRFIACSPLW